MYNPLEDDEAKKKAQPTAPTSSVASTTGAPQMMPPQAPTFAELQKQGRARPAPPSMGTMAPGMGVTGGPMQPQLPQSGATMHATGQPTTVGQGPVGSSLQQAVLANLGSPSRYGSDQAKATYDRLNSTLTEGFDTQRRKTNENLASRGVYDSTIAYGDLQGIDTQQGRAQTDLAARIAEQQATTSGTDMQSAIANALGYGSTLYGQERGNQNDSYNQDLGTAEFNANQDSQFMQMMMSLYGGA